MLNNVMCKVQRPNRPIYKVLLINYCIRELNDVMCKVQCPNRPVYKVLLINYCNREQLSSDESEYMSRPARTITAHTHEV